MGSVSFIDLIAARAAIKTGADRDRVRALLMDLDAGKSAGSFLESLKGRGILAADRIEHTKTLARQYFFMRNETAYLHYLKQIPAIDGPRVARVRETQAKGGYRERIGALLIRDGLIDEAADKRIGERARGALQRENDKQLQIYRGRSFEGIENLGQTTARQPVAPSAEPAPNASPANGAPVKAGPEEPANPMISSLQALFGDSKAEPSTAAQDSDSIPTRPLSSLGPQGTGIPTRPLSTLEQDAPPTPNGQGGVDDDEATDDGDDPAAPAAAIAASLGDPLRGTGLESRYRLVRKLGQGGMGAVYLAEDVEDQRKPVALKIALPDHQSEDGFGRFKREILCNSFLEHPNIVSVYDGGENSNGTYFMAMEYVEGEPFSERMKREGVPTVAVGLEVVEQVLEALIAAHTVRVVHRDLKPENFMCYEKPDGKLGIKLMDFGIARILDDEQQFSDQFFQTNIGQITGSPAYVAPESITEPQIDERADLYTLGVILYEFCVGRLPFRGKDPAEYLAKHLYAEPPNPREQAPHRGIAPALSAMILKLLAKKPRERYPSAKAVLEDLRENVLPSYQRDQTQVLTGRLTPTRLKQVMQEGADSPEPAAPSQTQTSQDRASRDDEDLGPTEVDMSPPDGKAPEPKRSGALRALAEASATAIKPAAPPPPPPAPAEAPRSPAKAPPPKPKAAPPTAKPSTAKPATAKPATKPITPSLPPADPPPQPRPGLFKRLLRAIFGR